MFLFSAELTALDDPFTYGVLAHEFQHMIHWYRDRNEEGWINEGFAELAAFINGYGVGFHDWAYVMDTDVQLNDWDPSGENSPHYGAAFLFLNYFLNRFGEDATKALVGDVENGMTSIDGVLESTNAVDSQTGEPVRADNVFADWAVTNYLLDDRVEDGRYDYANYPDAPQTSETETFNDCPAEPVTRDVFQYGVDYIRLDCDGDFTLQFEGSTVVGVLPEDPHSGSYAFWSNKGDESDMTLTRSFDFTEVSGPITLSYWTWYDLEEDYDYLYLVASENGEDWQILQTPSGTDEDPSSNSYGWGYNGQSGGWIQETVDLSEFAGKEVQLRFEYVTDAAVNGEGLLIDDLEIPEINYSTDFEADEGGWEGDGFVRIQNNLPQTYQVSIIRHGRDTTVETFPLSGDNTLEVPLQIGGDTSSVTLVVSGTTRFTRQRAAYRFSLTP
jgi:hypothetical protein